MIRVYTCESKNCKLSGSLNVIHYNYLLQNKDIFHLGVYARQEDFYFRVSCTIMIVQDFIAEIDQFVIDQVRLIRLKHKLTQQDIASIIGVSREFIRDVESIKRNSKYNLRHINALADYFNISPKDFLPEKAFADNPKEKTKPVKKTSSLVKKVVVQSKATKSKKK